jgi:catechol 2,3-dioxygenase-like lactoylglutathione lyase family enzyme
MQAAVRSGFLLRITSLVALWSLTVFSSEVRAQLASANAAGLRMGHVHLNVSDLGAQRKFWVEQFDARPITRVGLDGVIVPGMMILFTGKAPLQGSEGTVLDHFGFKVHSRDEMVQRARAAGFAVPREFKGSEGFPNAYITGPEGVKVEIQEEASLRVRAIAQHFHYLLPDPLQLRDWYVRLFMLESTRRGPYESADIPGVNLTFAPNRAEVGRSMKGGVIDHIGFEVRGLQALCRKLQAAGLKFETPVHKLPGLEVTSAMLIDPSGVYVELTEGLAAWDPFVR